MKNSRLDDMKPFLYDTVLSLIAHNDTDGKRHNNVLMNFR